MNADTTIPPAVAVTEPWFLDPAIAGRTVIYAEPDGGVYVVVDLAEGPQDISFLSYSWGPDGSPKGGYHYEGSEAVCDYEAELAAEDGIVDDVLRPLKTNATAASGYWEWLRGKKISADARVDYYPWADGSLQVVFTLPAPDGAVQGDAVGFVWGPDGAPKSGSWDSEYVEGQVGSWRWNPTLFDEEDFTGALRFYGVITTH